MTDELNEPDHPSLKSALIILVVSFILLAFVAVLPVEGLGKVQLVFGQMIFFLPGLALVYLKRYPFTAVFRLRKIDRKLVFCSLLLGLSFPLLVDELDRIVGKFIEMPPEFEEFLTTSLVADSLYDWILLVLAAVILAGITEEMLFRGLLQQALERRYDGINAIFLCALFFALFHGTPWWLIQIFVLGSLLGYLSWRSNSVYPAIIIHCMNNLCALLFTNLPGQRFEWYEWSGHVNPPVLAVSACVAFYSLRWFHRLTKTE